MPFVYRAALPLLAFSLLGFAGNGDVTPREMFEPTTGPRVALSPVSPPDTVRAATDPNTPLVLPLPAELNGQSIDRYKLLRGPALSGVAGRSFTWIPKGAAPGTYEALLQASTASSVSPDTLVVRIDLRSE